MSKDAIDFHAELGVKDVYSSFNVIEVANLDSVHTGSKHIDSIAVSHDFIEFSEGSKSYETNEIINADHRFHITDLNIEKYFEIEIGS